MFSSSVSSNGNETTENNCDVKDGWKIFCVFEVF